MNNKKIITTLFLLCLAIFMIFFFKPDKKQEFQTTQGVIFGTTYHISYQTEQGVKLDTAIARAFSQIDLSLSMFNPQSTISQFNHTDSISLSDTRFNHVLIHALKISEQTHGAFDITIAPLVNLYGFGFKKQEQITDSSILFALQNVGYKKLTISNNTLYKQHPDMMLDASAIAKGYACDYVAQTLRNYNVENLLVEIGGEVMAYGNNSKGNKWRIGINRPIEDSTSTVSQIQRKIGRAHV